MGSSVCIQLLLRYAGSWNIGAKDYTDFHKASGNSLVETPKIF
jgi:hypothetical protein